MKLYYSKGSCSETAALIADALNVSVEKIEVDLAKNQIIKDQSDFSTISPKGYVPALVLDSGEVITEVVAVSAYLASLAPNQTLFPMSGIEHIRQLEWFNYLATELHQSHGVLFGKAFGQNPSEDWFNASVQRLDRRYSYVESILKNYPYLTGDKLTAADIYLYIISTWAGFVNYDLSKFPSLVAFQKRMSDWEPIKSTLQ